MTLHNARAGVAKQLTVWLLNANLNDHIIIIRSSPVVATVVVIKAFTIAVTEVTRVAFRWSAKASKDSECTIGSGRRAGRHGRDRELGKMRRASGGASTCSSRAGVRAASVLAYFMLLVGTQFGHSCSACHASHSPSAGAHTKSISAVMCSWQLSHNAVIHLALRSSFSKLSLSNNFVN